MCVYIITSLEYMQQTAAELKGIRVFTTMVGYLTPLIQHCTGPLDSNQNHVDTETPPAAI